MFFAESFSGFSVLPHGVLTHETVFGLQSGAYKHSNILLDDAAYLQQLSNALDEASQLADQELNLPHIEKMRKRLWEEAKQRRAKQ